MTIKSKTIFPGLALTASVLGMACAALPTYALTPPALQLSVPGASVTIDSTGAQTYTGTCSATACPGTVTLASGVVSWTGIIGNFSVSNVSGQSKPALTAPQIDLGVTAITTGAVGGTITISWTDVGFTVGSSPGTMNILPSATGSAVYTSYVDSTNAPFGMKTEVGTTTTGGVVSGPGPTASPFSMTNVEAISLPAGVGSTIPPFGNDFSLTVFPTPPLSLSCGASTGTVGTPYSSSLVAHGGDAPYTFSITAGSISPLLLNSSTGAITGTPASSGTLSFTAQVVDSSGVKSSGTVSRSCSIVIAPRNTPPLKVLCPTSTATVGTYYSSTVVVTGGTPPYKFAVVLGTLPAGLTLNTSTGVISGTPTTASQTGAFKIQVTDSTGAIAYTNCSGSCSNGVTVSYGGSQSQNGWGDKGPSASYNSNGFPLNVYGFDTTGKPSDLYSSYSGGNAVLGINNWSNQNQIDSGHFVQFDISGNTGAGSTGTLLCVTSLNWNASYDVYGSNTKGSLGTLLASNVPANSNNQSVPNCNSYHYICVKAHSGSGVQVQCVQFTYSCACAIDVAQNNNNSGWGNSGGGNNYGGGGNNYGGGGQSNSPGQCGW